MPETQTGRAMVSNFAWSCFFYQYANHLPCRLLCIKRKYDFFTTFRFVSSHFILFLCQLNSFICHGDSYLFCFPYTYANYPSSGRFHWRQKCRLRFLRCLPLWAPFLFDYQDFISLASDFSFQHFNAEKIL